MKMNSMQTSYNLLISLPEILLLTDFKSTAPKQHIFPTMQQEWLLPSHIR